MQPVQPSFFATTLDAAQRFVLDLDTGKCPDLRLVCAGVEHCRPDYRVQRDTFAWYGLEIVLAGHGQVVLAGTHHHLVPGSVYTYGPGISHDIHCHREQPLQKFFIDCWGDDVPQHLAAADLALGSHRCVHLGMWERECLDLLLRSADTVDAAERCRHLVHALLCALRHAPRLDSARQHNTQQRYLSCRATLDRLPVDATLHDLAAACRLSPAYLCRLFKKAGARSPSALLRRRRLQYAINQLDPDDSLSHAATIAGYSDQFHFSRAFRQEFGYPPSQARG